MPTLYIKLNYEFHIQTDLAHQLPVMMSILMEQLINITDAIFLGHYGEVELGASALAGMYYLILYMLGFGFSLGLQVMVARRNGEQKYDETGKVFFQGLFFLVVLAVFLFLLSKGLHRLFYPDWSLRMRSMVP